MTVLPGVLTPAFALLAMRVRFPRNNLVRDVVSIAIIVAVYLAIALPRYRIGIDWSDEGFLAYGAERVLEGQVPNRDFVSVQPPLSFYTVALMFKLFGASLVALRWFGVGLHVATGLLIYLISRQFVRPLFACAAALPAAVLGVPVFGFAPFAIWQGLIAALIAMLLYLRATFSGGKSTAGGAGVLTALAFAMRQDQAAFIALAILFATLVFALADEERRPQLRSAVLWWLAGIAVTMIVLTGLSLVAGAFSGMWQQLVVFPLTTYAKTSSTPFPRWDSALPLARNLLTLACYLPLLFPAATLIFVLKRVLTGRFYAAAATGAFLSVWSLLAYCELLTRSDLQHFLPALPACLVLAAFAFDQGWQRFRSLSGRIAISTAALLIAAYVCVIGPAAISDPRASNLEQLDLPRGGTRVPAGKWISDFVKGVQAYVPPNRSILVLPYEPLFYFLCERHNPTRWNYLWPGDQTAADHAELIAETQREPPAVIFITNEKAMGEYASTILDYVHGSYKLTGTFGQLNVYFPNDAPTR